MPVKSRNPHGSHPKHIINPFVFSKTKLNHHQLPLSLEFFGLNRISPNNVAHPPFKLIIITQLVSNLYQ
ncbi:hypothetical protein HanIR_Chr14g0685541 [Helianthus annuus]|nr:hypothetical protein HanIR_Chr14g0685541 [Helianthus annuus]